MTYARPTDLPPPPAHVVTERPLHVHLHAKLCDPATLSGGVVIMIDALRASVTMTAALANGAKRVLPAFSVEDARAKKVGPYADALLGGERGGALIAGFDLDNSPLKYTREKVAGRTIIFTTTNGTASLFHAAPAAEILVGSFANCSAICAHVAKDPRAVHILCAGTRDEISLDDCLPAGAMVDQLVRAGRQLIADDSGRLAHAAYMGAIGSRGGLPEAMRQSRGGRNLANMGLGADVDFCSTLDTLSVVPRFDPRSGEVTLFARGS